MTTLQRQQFDIQYQTQALNYTKKLVGFKSITPEDGGAFHYMCQWLENLGFEITDISSNGVKNLLAKKVFGPGPCIGFSGHLDVVPADGNNWKSPPFIPTIDNGRLYGRGVADMKGAIACFMTAVEQLNTRLNTGTLYWLITCDEEGEAKYGTKLLVEHLKKQQQRLDLCIVGEPTGKNYVGDTIKIGRRGAISAKIIFNGKAKHVAYAKGKDNITHTASTFAAQLAALSWDEGSDDFPGTSLQITLLDSGAFSDNVVPAQCTLCFNVRFSHKYSLEDIKKRVVKLLEGVNESINIVWERYCAPFHLGSSSSEINFLMLTETVIHEVTGRYPVLSTNGGTSDGRFIAILDTQIIELGLCNQSIHQANESIDLIELSTLTALYYQLVSKVLIA
ncbi:MAG: succinyl-diaminopimelate desuccinylase [Alteromonadaceae bacterium]|jgi:succinyl-diaminopimelate desuccinylase